MQSAIKLQHRATADPFEALQNFGMRFKVGKGVGVCSRRDRRALQSIVGRVLEAGTGRL